MGSGIAKEQKVLKDAHSVIRRLASASSRDVCSKGACTQHKAFLNTCSWSLHPRSVGKGQDDNGESKYRRDFQLHSFRCLESYKYLDALSFLPNPQHRSAGLFVSSFEAAKNPYLPQEITFLFI